MTPAQRIFKRALAEKLAFIPMGPQAAGPGGAPVDPMAAGGMPSGAPMDPAMAGMPPGAPMDPMAAGGMPPGAPMDPMAGMPPGAPMDPAMAGGMPPMDPAMDPMAAAGGLPPVEPPPDAPPAEGLTKSDVETVDTITQRTMDIVRQTLEMVGKAKTKTEGGGEAAPAAPAPAAQPGPVSGMPGFDPSMIQGPLKTAAVLSVLLARR